MSMRDVKWTAGAPDQLKVGMVLKSGDEVNLIGSTEMWGAPIAMLSGNPIEKHGQVVEPYELEWLGNDGLVPAKVAACA